MNRPMSSTAFSLAILFLLALCLPSVAQDAARDSGTQLRALVASRKVITEEDLSSSRPHPSATATGTAEAASATSQIPDQAEGNSPEASSAAKASLCGDLAELRRAKESLTRHKERLSALREAAKTDLRQEIYANALSQVEAELTVNQEEIDYIVHGGQTKCSASPAEEPAGTEPQTSKSDSPPQSQSREPVHAAKP